MKKLVMSLNVPKNIMVNKRILVTGGAGSIGSELVRQLCKDNEVYVLDLNETAFFDLYEELRLESTPIRGRVGDIRNLYTLDQVFGNFKPEVVFHLAALKHVTPAEHDPREYFETNELGTCNVVETAKKYGVEKLIFTSSDKAVRADKIYGLTKRGGEFVVRNAGYTAVRFGNVLGSRGSVIPIWQKQIDEGKPLSITDERMERFFMSIPEACRLLIEAADTGEPGSIMVMDMGKTRNILEIAKEILGKIDKADYPIKVIGARPGESLTEELMTPDEQAKAIKQGNFYVIR